jgi:hypothetical protein
MKVFQLVLIVIKFWVSQDFNIKMKVFQLVLIVIKFWVSQDFNKKLKYSY